ncbi:metallophosphoesterase [Sphingorhabdus sp. Alg239-R122]|uniref:metallophosphoesterase n=1 Tax=Sphingorhabdus sp. Alg239-R122 TaxID=2305989 RepID=UPI0013DA1E39|nr:metallophosphoesterase [Sphingorhabdus sp. Alg239-R122]
MILRRLFLLAILPGLALVAFMYHMATRDPVVREAVVVAPAWPEDVLEQRIVLISDVHVAGPDMPPERLARIVEQVNALKPDLVLFAGDFVSDKVLSTHTYEADEALVPLTDLKARLGVAAVMGNHDHWRERDRPEDIAIAEALKAANVRVLSNEAARFGPFVVGGVDDDYTGHSDLPKTLTMMQALAGSSDPGAPPPMQIVLSHSPDIFPDMASPGNTADAMLMLAGHTHCGQIAPPFVEPLATASKYGRRYVCGRVDEDGKTLIVGAGLGTSILPLRLGAVPDMWLITVEGEEAAR